MEEYIVLLIHALSQDADRSDMVGEPIIVIRIDVIIKAVVQEELMEVISAVPTEQQEKRMKLRLGRK